MNTSTNVQRMWVDVIRSASTRDLRLNVVVEMVTCITHVVTWEVIVEILTNASIIKEDAHTFVPTLQDPTNVVVVLDTP